MNMLSVVCQYYSKRENPKDVTFKFVVSDIEEDALIVCDYEKGTLDVYGEYEGMEFILDDMDVETFESDDDGVKGLYNYVLEEIEDDNIEHKHIYEWAKKYLEERRLL